MRESQYDPAEILICIRSRSWFNYASLNMKKIVGIRLRDSTSVRGVGRYPLEQMTSL